MTEPSPESVVARWLSFLLQGLPIVVSVLLAAASLSSGGAPALAQEEVSEGERLATEIDAQLQRALNHEDPRSFAEELTRLCIVEYGEIDPLLSQLRKIRDDIQRPFEQRLPALRLLERLLRQRGDLIPALSVLRDIPNDRDSEGDCLSKAEVLDALGRDEQALEHYARLLQFPVSEQQRHQILLRQALLQPPAPPAPEREGDAAAGAADAEQQAEPRANPGANPRGTALARFARESNRAPTLRNSAALILALQESQKDAIEAYAPQHAEPGSKRFREQIRLAEWALEAELWDAAQEFSWQACQAAALKRDRRYGLTILAETYRRDQALAQLISRFEREEQLDDDSRQTWIDLLRETGRVDEAIRLFRDSPQGDSTIDMRRELLEMCRESNQDQILVDAYRELIQQEPRFIEWREGLSRGFLERGNRSQAESVWHDYLDTTQDSRYRMAAATTLMNLGLDATAERFARACMNDEASTAASLLFLFELHFSRARMEQAQATLQEIDEGVEPKASARKELAECYARMGNKIRAVEVLTALKESLGDDSAPDSDMKLALLLSEVDREEEALDLWREIWRRIDSIPRRRYVEGRLMNVASRLGTLAKIAVDLEMKLSRGEADDRDAGLLVRLYTKVKDPVSATEVVEEHMSQQGKKPAEVLAEKARIFMSCEDFYNYDKTIRALIEVDPEGRPDYLRQLAMSNLERGKQDQAKQILDQLKLEDADSSSLEFEAGVLALAGMREESLKAYRRCLAANPGRIDTYLLLSNTMKELGQFDRSAGMFQYLAATAERDDLFTIAIDGILNMRDGRANRGAPDRLVEWARRVTLERVAQRPDKLYLYQLVADLSSEIRDNGMAMRALKMALPIAGEQRTALLRELMTMAKGQEGGPNAGVVWVLVNGIAQPQRNSTEKEVNVEQLMFGRRLLGQGELVPPQVYLELGEAFLDAGEVSNATKTFNQASQLPEFADLQRDIAKSFEKARFPREALRVYEGMLMVETADVGLITKVAELHEQLGRDEVARELYQRGMELYLSRKPFVLQGEKEEEAPAYFGRNVDASEKHRPWLEQGLLATCSADPEFDRYLEDHVAQIEQDLVRRKQLEDAPAESKSYPCLTARADLVRRLAPSFARVEVTEALDRKLLTEFPEDEDLLKRIVRLRLNWGMVVSARQLIEDVEASEEIKQSLRVIAGVRGDEITGRLKISEAKALLLPLLVEGRHGQIKNLLERLELTTEDSEDTAHMPLLLATTIYLGESELALGLCRHWLNLAIRHQSGAFYGFVENVLKQGRMVLNSDQQRSLVEYVIDKVVEEPDKFSSFAQRLPDLQKELGEGLLTTEQVEKLISSRLDANDRFIYGIPEMFALIDSSDRSSVLRTIWPKVPKSQKASFLVQLTPSLEQTIEPGFGEFLVGAFQQGLESLEQPEMLQYYARDLTDVPADNLPISLRMLEALLDKDKSNVGYRVAVAVCHQKLGRDQQALATAKEVFQELAGAESRDYQSNSAIRQILDEFAEQHLEALLEIVNELAAKQPDNVRLIERRLELIRRKKDDALLGEELLAAVEKFPEETSIVQQVCRYYDTRGDLFNSVEYQTRLVEVDDKNAVRHRDRLINQWNRLRNPIAVLRIRKGVEEKKSESKGGEKKEREIDANIGTVKEAFDGDDAREARRLYRRLWRVFPDRDAQYFYWQGSGGNVIYWPRDPRAEEPGQEKKRARGGLPDFVKIYEAEQKKLRGTSEEPEDADGENESAEESPLEQKRRSASEVLVEVPLFRAELERQLRSMSAEELNSARAQSIYKALSQWKIEQSSYQEVVNELLAAEQEGRVGRKEYGELFALLEQAPEGTRDDVTSTLSGLLENVDPKDTGQIRRLARLYAKSGFPQKAAALYTWCSTAQQRSGFSYYDGASDLLREVMENLEGELRDDVVETLLAFSDPGEDSWWGRDRYDEMVLRTWYELRGASGALDRSRKLCEEMLTLDSIPRRRGAQWGAFLFAFAGDFDNALRSLEVGTCELTPPTHLKYPWYKSYFTRGERLGFNELCRLFPPVWEGWADADEWLQRAAEKVQAWAQEERLLPDTAFQALALIALRLQERGNSELAADLLEKCSDLADDNSRRLLWIADLYRKLEQEPRAHEIELRLLRERRLHVERIPEVVARVAAADGPEAALALAEGLVEFVPHPDLIATLQAAAIGVGDESREQQYQQLAEQLAAAEAELKAREES